MHKWMISSPMADIITSGTNLRRWLIQDQSQEERTLPENKIEIPNYILKDIFGQEPESVWLFFFQWQPRVVSVIPHNIVRSHT